MTFTHTFLSFLYVVNVVIGTIAIRALVFTLEEGSTS